MTGMMRTVLGMMRTVLPRDTQGLDLCYWAVEKVKKYDPLLLLFVVFDAWCHLGLAENFGSNGARKEEKWQKQKYAKMSPFCPKIECFALHLTSFCF